jgi:hypothetical protein
MHYFWYCFALLRTLCFHLRNRYGGQVGGVKRETKWQLNLILAGEWQFQNEVSISMASSLN